MDILLIEDEEVLINILKRKLEKKNYQLGVIKNGEGVLEKIKADEPNLILLDVETSRIDGFELLRKMNRNADLKEIPVIIITNSGEPEQLKKAQELGVADWITKTEFNPQEAINKVEQKIN